jgi:hypothetical protein
VLGKLLSENTLHLRTLATLSVQLRYLTHFNFFVIKLLGQTEAPDSSAGSSNDAKLLLRLFTPVLKATTAKMGVAFLSECMECLGGQGYVEEGGIAVHYRDIQVNAIWEGTTNILANDMLRVLRGKSGVATLAALDRYIEYAIGEGEKCAKLGDYPHKLGNIYLKWRSRLTEEDEGIVTAHARELCLWLGRTIGAMEMMIDAASDGDDVEIECCKRIFDVKNQGWEDDARKTADWDRRIVFGQDTCAIQARL